MYFDFDDDGEFQVQSSCVRQHGGASTDADTVGANRPDGPSSSPLSLGAVAGSSTAAAALDEDAAAIEDIAAQALVRYGERPPSEALQQMALHLRAQRVKPLPQLAAGGEWEVVERHPWRRVEMRRRSPEARGVRDTRFRPPWFRRGSARDEHERRCPKPGDRIQVRLRACARSRAGGDEAFLPIAASEEWIDCLLSDGCLPEGVEKALARLAVGDLADVRCVGEACLREVPVDHIEHIPPDGFLVWEVFLLRIISVSGIDNPRCYSNQCVADSRMKVSRAVELRSRGNALLKAGRMVKAIELYTSAVDFTSMVEPTEKDLGLDRMGPEMTAMMPDAKAVNKFLRDLRKPILLNHALAAQKLGRWQLGADLCKDLLADDPNCVKALFRRGRSLLRLKDFQEARICFTSAQQLDDSIAPQVRKEMVLLRKRQQEAEKPLRGSMAKMLGQSAPKPDVLVPQERAAAIRPKVAEAAAALATGGLPEQHEKEPPEELGAEKKLASQQPFVKARISVICPTTEARHEWHPQLYGCFLCQTYEDCELIVMDSGRTPSPFFTRLADPRVRYVHVQAATVGAKRNRCVALASGEFVAHFDDDDLYAPPYLERMQAHLVESGSGAIKLASWNTLDTQAGICGFLDSECSLPGHLDEQRRAGLFRDAYGFSLFYRRDTAMHVGFLDTSWGEDVAFVRALRATGTPLSYIHDHDFLCLHTQHGANHSRSIAQNLVEPKCWKSFVLQLRQHIQAYAENLDKLRPPVSVDGGWDGRLAIAGNVRAALALGTARVHDPDPVPPPAGLFVCSLYDEYYQALEAKWDRERRHPDGVDAASALTPASLDPLVAWRCDYSAGVAPWPHPDKHGVFLAPDPLKPTEDLSQRRSPRHGRAAARGDDAAAV